MTHQAQSLFRALTGVAVCLAVGVLPAWTPVASADDRSLVKSSESEPYVMILFDTTGSMNSNTSGSNPPLHQDDPASKMFQAKTAIYNALLGVNDVHFGFATFPNQDELRVFDKSCSNNCINTGDIGHTNACAGWDPNTDSAEDVHSNSGVNLRRPTTSNPNDPGYSPVMDYGDVIPMDWDSIADRALAYNSDNNVLIRRILAPNLNLDGDGDTIPAYLDPDDPEAIPDFGVARYFTNSTTNGVHTLLNASARPILADGLTPLARALRDFSAHYALWKPLAEANDPKFGCKKKYVILITDGLDTCEPTSTARQNEPPAAAGEVHAQDVDVWVVGYSISGTGKSVLNNMANQGGTDACPIINGCDPSDPTCCPGVHDEAFFPSTSGQLSQALTRILNEIRGEARSFAAAAVPQGQANADDTIFLASFLPFKGLPLWPGSLDAYLRPLPLKDVVVTLPDGTTESRKVPDRSRLCPGNADDTACRLWDAGEEMLVQGATDAQLMAQDYNLGTGATQRRVLYSVEDSTVEVPAARKDFLPTTISDTDAGDLMRLMGCEDPTTPFTGITCDPTDTNNLAVMHGVASWVHKTKQYEIPGSPGVFQDYLLGEIFHSDPVVVGNPEAFRYYAVDLFADRPTKALLSQGLDVACGDQGDGENPGFVCFFEKHRYRRKVALLGSNDGQVHAFDAGVFDGTKDATTDVITGEFTNGTGRELFSFIPRTAMRTLTDQAQGDIELYGVDGRLQAAEVFIDPLDDGATFPNEDHREWRTVAIAGLREGGRGYYALDVTQPDVFDTDDLPDPAGSSLNNGKGYVPSCSAGGTGCGTLPYPSVLWEFEDLCPDPFSPNPLIPILLPCDDDINLRVDLADGWSRPNIGIVEVCVDPWVDCGPGGDDVRTKFVSVFGGGFDPDEPADRGNFIYVVDIETGKAIYKRAVSGAVASEPAAVDTDQDGILDTIYVGTVTGFMYKVDLTGRPDLVNVSGTGLRVTDISWDPFPLFQDPGGRPIFYPPSVIFVGEVGEFAVAFGTGYREDLWTLRNETARFYMVLDRLVDTSVSPAEIRPYRRTDAIGASPVLPLSSSSLNQVDPEATTSLGTNLLISPTGGLLPGWWMELQNEERVIAPPFALSGLLVFLTFQPDEVITGGGRTCANSGQGRSFTVLSTNGDPLITGKKKYTIIDDLPTSPYTESGSIKNPVPTSGETEQGVPPELQPVLNALKRLFPRECRFANYTVNVKTRRADTGIQFIAPVPICIVQKNWMGN